MGRYLLKRIVQIIPVLLILTLIIFCLVYVAGDPVALMLPPEAGEQAKAALREALGLDKPFYEQFFIYIGNLLRGDFGTSYQYNQDALSLVMERMPYSLQLAGVSLLFSVIVGIVLGVAAAHFRNTPFDLLVNGFAALGQAMPGFWVAIMLILKACWPRWPAQSTAVLGEFECAAGVRLGHMEESGAAGGYAHNSHGLQNHPACALKHD